MKYLIYLSLVWNFMLTLTVVLVDQYYGEVTSKIAVHIVETHKRIAEHEHTD